MMLVHVQEAAKGKKKAVGKQVVTYDVPTALGDKKGSVCGILCVLPV